MDHGAAQLICAAQQHNLEIAFGPFVKEPMLSQLFLDHPRSVGESYFEHQRTALEFAGWMLVGCLACLIHAFVPAAFRTTGSRTVGRLYRKMILSRSKLDHATAGHAVRTEMPSVEVWELWEI